MRLFRWRLSKVDKDLHSETLDTLYDKLVSGEDPKATWIAFRLMEEESQRIAIDGEASTYMPNLPFPDILETIIQKHEEFVEESQEENETAEEEEKIEINEPQ
jgi:hypothetical protein